MNKYNANIYLTPTDLNNIEDMVEDITNEVQEKIFDNTQSPLKSIQVGNNLSGKTLYLSFPRNSYENITSSTRTDVITIDNNTRIAYIHNNAKTYIYVRYKNTSYFLYAKNDSSNNPYLNVVRYKLPNDFGVVTQVNNTDTFYQYIKIYDNENVIPNYVKNTYSINDVLTMKQIDNIENGIKNIGYYYYKPIGFLGNREWLGTAELGKSNIYGTNMQNISYIDLNRWLTNLQSIDFESLNEFTIWNSSVSEIDWNKQNSTEWEDY